MVSTINAGSGLSDAEHGVQLRRAVIASTVGTAIEWYDFFLYGTAAGLVFPKLFFPNDDPLVGTLNSFLIYGAGFLARPVGAAIFGHYGDRIGRKATLIATLMLMGIATFLVAFVPTYSSIGVWGAIILTVLRFIQGVGVGGEWGGSVLLSMEWARSDKSRGFIASWPQFGVPCGLFLANLAFLVFSQAAGDQFLRRLQRYSPNAAIKPPAIKITAPNQPMCRESSPNTNATMKAKIMRMAFTSCRVSFSAGSMAERIHVSGMRFSNDH